MATSGLLLAALGCRDEAESPTEPVSSPTGEHASPALAVASNTWIVRADMPTGRFGLAAAVVPDATGQSILYAIGGGSPTLALLGKVEAYNVATNTWSTKASLPRVLQYTNGTGVIGGRIFLSGGITSSAQTYSNHLYRYNPATNIWAEKHAMPAATFGGATGVIDGKLYVLTSCTHSDRCPVALPVAFYRYDPVTDQWAVLPAPARGHELGMGGVIGGKFYVTGGLADGEFENLQLDVYDPASNTWTARAPLPRARFGGAGVALAGKLYVIGGSRRTADQLSIETLRSVNVYDPIADAWTSKAPLPSAHPAIAGGRVVLNGQPRIEVVGGSRPGNNLQYIP